MFNCTVFFLSLFLRFSKSKSQARVYRKPVLSQRTENWFFPSCKDPSNHGDKKKGTYIERFMFFLKYIGA